MAAREPLFDIVKAIQVAEKEAFTTLGAKSAVEARQMRRDAARKAKAKRWRYVQERARTAFSGTYRGSATDDELEDSVRMEDSLSIKGESHRFPQGVDGEEVSSSLRTCETTIDPEPQPKEPSMLRKLLTWKD